MDKENLIHAGSVKNVWASKGSGDYIFQYTDKYSVFDWGEMPDLIEKKGEALAVMADLIFKYLESPSSWRNLRWHNYRCPKAQALKESPLFKRLCDNGVLHHSRGLVDNDNEKVALGEVSNRLAVNPINVIKPRAISSEGSLQYDYSKYRDILTRTLVPLEVIFRFGISQGSSLKKRLEENPGYANELGLDCSPSEGEFFAWPVVEFSTKLESTDRVLSLSEAQQMAGLSASELEELLSTAKCVALNLQELFNSFGVKLWDGKLEFAFGDNTKGQREFILVDSIGPDELRLTYNGIQLSKEVFRQFYHRTPWEQALREAKEVAKRRASGDWKEICVDEFKKTPGPLSFELKYFGEKMYQVLANEVANAVIGKKVFDMPDSLKSLFPSGADQ